MSKRYPRNKQFSVSVTGEHKEKLVKLAQSSKIDQKQIACYLIDLAEKYDLLKPGWEKRLQDVADQRARYDGLDTACPALGYAEKYYQCIWGQDGKPPKSKKLAREIDEAFEVCEKCKITLEIKMENESYQAKIRDLELLLQSKADETFKVPVCQFGAILQDDGQSFKGCRRSSVDVSISSYCKVRKDGKPCDMYVERVIAVGSKLK